MKAIIAILYAAAVAVLSAIGFGYVFGHLSPKLAAASLMVGALAGMVSLWLERNRPQEKWKIDPLGSTVLIAFALFALLSFLWLAFESGDDLYVFSVNNL